MRHERRHHPRLEIPLETELRLAGSEEQVSVTMQDLSAGGAGLLTTTEIPVGTDIDWLRFEMPGGDGVAAQAIEVAGQVARCEQQAGLGGEAEFLIGVQFVGITRELFDRIQKFVFQRLRADQKERVQIERPIAIRFDRFDDFVDEVSVNLSTSGMFIRTRDPRPPGSVFNFQFQLGEDFNLIEGRAEVVWRRRQSEGPDKPPGMGVRFLNLDVPSQRLIDRLIAQRHEAAAAAEAAPEPEPAASEVAPAPEPEPAASEVAPAPEPAATGLETEERPAPPSLEQAEASLVRLGQLKALQETANQLRAELNETRREHELRLHELRSGLENRQAVASGELEERLRDTEAAHQESERQRRALAAELDSLGQETEELRQQLAGSVSAEELEHLAGERDELQKRLDGLRGELDKVREQAGELQRQLDDSTAEEEIQRLTGERAEIQAAHDQIQTAHDELQAAHDELRADLEQARAEAEQLQAARDDLQTSRETLRADLEQARGEAGGLQALLDNRLSEEEAERLSSERDALRATNERLLADLDRANGEADELRRRLDDRARGEIHLRAEIESAQSEIDQLQQTHEATVLQLRADHSAALESTVLEAQEEAAARLQELTAAREERDRLEADAARERQSLRQEAEAADREAAAQLEGLRQELTAANERSESLEGELDSARQELASLRERSEGLEGELDSTRQELAEARGGATEEAQETAAAIAVARDESERLRGEIAAAEESRRTLESELQQVREEARQAALHAEERENSLRAEAENAALALAGGMPQPVAESRGGGRAIAGIALLLIGALLGTLAVTLFEPLGSLAARLRPGAERTVLSALPTTPDTAASQPPPVLAQPSAEPTPPGVAGGPATAAIPTVAEPPPEPEPGPDPATAEQAVRDWAAAWSDQRADDYLASYADSFQPPDGQSRDSWAATRRQRIQRPRSLEVEVEAARTVELANGRVSVSFDQAYRSDTFSDQVRKTLLLVWQDGAWKIAEERVIE